MKPPPLRIDHLALPMYDAAATRIFYEEVLGLPLLDAHSGDDWHGMPWLMMIFGDADGRQLAAWKRKLGDAGIAWREEDHGRQRSIYFEDPNGNTLEITSPPTPKVAKRRAGAARVVERWLRVAG